MNGTVWKVKHENFIQKAFKILNYILINFFKLHKF